jgi:hypothetical protein
MFIVTQFLYAIMGNKNDAEIICKWENRVLIKDY